MVTKKIKILNIVTGGLRREGIASTQLEFVKNLKMDNLKMDFVAVHNNEDDIIEDFKKNNCDVEVLPDRHEHLFKYIISLYKKIKKEKYDIVHVHGSSSLMAIELLTAKVAGVKIRIAHSRNTKCLNNKAHKILKPLFNISYTKALACGKDAGRWLFGKKDFTVVHNGKNFEKFKFSVQKRKELRKKLKLKDELCIGYVGNLNEQKNLLFLIDIFKEYQTKNDSSLLFLIGEGPSRKKIEDYIKNQNLEDKIIFTGRISNVNEYLQAMDVMCLTSIYEGLPNVVLEWQISGLPSLVSNKITDECKVTQLVEFLPIDSEEDKKIWAEKIINFEVTDERKREKYSSVAQLEMKKNSFDIKDSTEFVRNIYFNEVKKIDIKR